MSTSTKKATAERWAPCILIAKEKHEDRFFYLPTKGSLHRAALRLLRERHREGWYAAPSHPGALGFTSADVPNLPPILQLEATDLLKSNAHLREQCEKELRQIAAIESALRDKDGVAAWRILVARRNHEYENVRMVDCEVVR